MSKVARSAVSIRGLAIRYVAKHIPMLLDALDKNGWFRSDHYFIDDVATEYHQYGYFNFAELYTLQHRDNPYYQKEKLLKAALLAGDLTAREVGDDGLTLFSSQGYSWSRSHMGWRVYFLMQTFLRLKAYLGDAREKLWRAAIDRMLVGTVQSVESRRSDPHYCKDAHVHNLYMWSTLCCHRARTDFNRPELGEMADVIFKEVVQAQKPGGYWHENGGPVNVYDHVTSAGLAVYAEETQAPWAREAMRKNLKFHSQFTYPDGVPVETVDGRVRYTHYPITILPASWANFPEGRGYVRALISAAMKAPFGGGDAPHGPWLGYPFIGEAIRFLPDNVLPDETWTPDPAYKIPGAEAAIVRSDPWTISAAAICVPPSPEFRWHLARQNLISIYHQKAGLLLGGGNSKEIDFSTVVVHDKDGAARYVPNASEVAILDNKRGLQLKLTYGKTVVQVEVLTEAGDAAHAEVRWTVLEAGPTEVIYGQATLLPHNGEKLSWGKGASIKLGDQRVSLSDYELSGKKIETEATDNSLGWKHAALRLPAETLVRWPLEAYNTHRVDNRYPPYKRVLGVRFPIKAGEPKSIRIEPK